MRSIRISYLLFLLCGLVSAQQGPSPLIGKIIHVYNPIPGESLYVDMSGTGYNMTPETGSNWLTFTVPTGIQDHINKFGVRSSYSRQPASVWIARTGLAAGGADAFVMTDFGAGNEVWIIIDPSGPTTAPPEILLQPPKVINVLNPWPTTAPVVVLSGGRRKSMLTVSDRCGWFTAFLMKPTDYQLHFAEISNMDTYGRGGFGTATDYDLTSEFASKGSTLWLDKDLNSWTAAWPNKDGECQYLMAATVRDFSIAHPDFDPGVTGDQSVKGMAAAALPANRRIVGSGKTHQLFSDFPSWWTTSPTHADPAKRSHETCVDLPMSKSADGMWEYDSYNTPEKGFWPIENFNRFNEVTPNSCYKDFKTNQYVSNQPGKNMNFCMEAHAKFVYRKGQKFSFRGDDDVWVYINNKLVIDLGGIHEAQAMDLNLDTLGLEENKEYNWDFFFCERQKCSSSLRIKTSIFFRQQRALDTVMTPDPTGIVRAKIIKRIGGTGSCASEGDSVRVVDASNLVYQLWNATNQVVDSTLKDGTFYNGGIVIATPNVSVDTSKIETLPPGNYRIVAFEPANQGVRVEVPFTIRNRSWVQFEPKEVTVVAGTRVPVVAANRIGTAAPTGAMAYTFTVQPGSGLQVFDAAAGTVTVANSGTTGDNGLDTLWVTVDTEIPAQVTYTLATTGSAQQVKVTFTPRPLDLPVVNTATIHDEDADGIADRIVATYDRDISSLAPKQVAHQWPASAAQVPTPGASLAGRIAGTVLTLSGTPLGTEVLTAGTGWFHSTYPARGGRDSTQTVPLVDRIAPVLLRAEMLGDTLRLAFSEPINTSGLAAPAELFVYRLNQTGTDLSYSPTELRWNTARDGADLIFPPGSTEAPRSGNLVRIKDGAGRIADAAGNGAGPNSRFRLITGTKKADVATVTYLKVDPTKLVANPAALAVSLEGTNAKVEEVVERTGRLGHLIKVDLGDHAQADDFNPVDPAQVSLEYQVGYFTNHGQPIASEKRTVSCLDKTIFNGDCRANRGYLFVGWNFNTLKAQRVGTGAYVARIRYKVVAAGKTPVAGDLDQIWGVLRSN